MSAQTCKLPRTDFICSTTDDCMFASNSASLATPSCFPTSRGAARLCRMSVKESNKNTPLEIHHFSPTQKPISFGWKFYWNAAIIFWKYSQICFKKNHVRKKNCTQQSILFLLIIKESKYIEWEMKQTCKVPFKHLQIMSCPVFGGFWNDLCTSSV